MSEYNKHKITTLLEKENKLSFNDAVNSFEYKINLSPNIELHKDGYVIARNAVVGNTGPLKYSERELGWSNSNKPITVLREDADVFDERSLASLEGAPITIKHPKGNVSSKTFKDIVHGTVLGKPIREGKNMVVDLIFQSEEIVDLLAPEVQDENGKLVRKLNESFRDLSLGYTAKLVKVAQDLYKQTNIIYNHLALVPEGRQVNATIVDEKNILEKEVGSKMGVLEKLFKRGKKVAEDENGNIIISNEEVVVLTDEEETEEVKTKEEVKDKKEVETKKEEKVETEKEVEDEKEEEANKKVEDNEEEKQPMKDMKYFQDELIKVNALPDSPIKQKAIEDLNKEFYDAFPDQKPKEKENKGFADAVNPVEFNDNTQKEEQLTLRFEEVVKKKNEYYSKLTDPFEHSSWKEFNDNFDKERKIARSINKRFNQ